MESATCPVFGARDWRPYRGATRYPLHLRVTLLCDGREIQAITEDLSASGVLLQVTEPLRVGQEIPAGTLGFSVTAAVHCFGRVVRSCFQDGQPFAAAVIDDYRFQ
jgi:hypothetical protein